MTSSARSTPTLLGAYERHLASERGLSEHTVRAYRGDVRDLLDHLTRLGLHTLADVDLRSLRSWLAKQQTLGRARTTHGPTGHGGAGVHRVGALHRADPDRRGRPAGHSEAASHPAEVLTPAQASALMEQASVRAVEDGPIGVRDVAILELLYATGIRVGELVGLDVDDLDEDRRVVRVFGKGRKERVVPYGVPAADALQAWSNRCAPELARAGSGPALFLGARGRRIDQRAVRRLVHAGSPTSPVHPTSARTACDTPPRPTCSRAARTCARCRRSSGTPRSRPRRSTRM